MAEISGKNASVSCGGNGISGIREWSIDYSADTPETTDFDDGGHRTYIGGLDGWTGSFNGFGQPGWDTNASLGTTYAGKFYVSSTGGAFYSGSVIINGISLGQSVDGIATTDYSVQGTGALTYSAS